jgi:hypothetical protein
LSLAHVDAVRAVLMNGKNDECLSQLGSSRTQARFACHCDALLA